MKIFGPALVIIVASISGAVSAQSQSGGDTLEPVERVYRLQRGTAYSSLPTLDCSNGCLTTRDAIERAAELAPNGAALGRYILTVKAVGSDKERWYINSETDYRDPRNVSVALSPTAAAELRALLKGESFESALLGKQIIVAGPALRVQIAFFSNGKKTDKYYYQTHIAMQSVRQIWRPLL